MVTSDTISVLKELLSMLLLLVEFRNLVKFIDKSFSILRIFPDCLKDALDH